VRDEWVADRGLELLWLGQDSRGRFVVRQTASSDLLCEVQFSLWPFAYPNLILHDAMDGDNDGTYDTRRLTVQKNRTDRRSTDKRSIST
jgi:hypothetical protein